MPIRVMTVLGTRPEAIKLAPVVHAMRASSDVEHVLCSTGQHRTMLDQVLEIFQITPERDLNLMKSGQSLTHVTSAVLEGVGAIIDEVSPDWVVVQGDTTTAFAAALAAFYRKIKIAHVEAGLRSGNLYSPWPEEANRKLVGALTNLHFPPTALSAENLRKEGVPAANILVTGNTVIDSLQWVSRRLADDEALRTRLEAKFDFLNRSRRLILVTGHRRENFDGGLDHVCKALRTLADRGDVEVVYPVHLNPHVQEAAKKSLSNHPRVHLIEPLDYEHFIALMRLAYIIITDSGGIQEEGPSLAKPVLVTRDTTERPEAITAGTAKLVGTKTEDILKAATELLDDAAAFNKMAQAKNPFGDGKASERIMAAICGYRG